MSTIAGKSGNLVR